MDLCGLNFLRNMNNLAHERSLKLGTPLLDRHYSWAGANLSHPTCKQTFCCIHHVLVLGLSIVLSLSFVICVLYLAQSRIIKEPLSNFPFHQEKLENSRLLRQKWMDMLLLRGTEDTIIILSVKSTFLWRRKQAHACIHIHT